MKICLFSSDSQPYELCQAVAGAPSGCQVVRPGPQQEDQFEAVARRQRGLKRPGATTRFDLSIGKNLDWRCNLQTARIETCIQHALDEIGPAVLDKQIAVSVNVIDGGAPLYSETARIERVMVNLLKNAAKFTPKGGRIAVSAYPVSESEKDKYILTRPTGPVQPQAYRVDVTHTRSGSLEQNLENVFEECTPYRGPMDRSSGGLGLTICEAIVMAHGGRIWAENHSAGARLSFVLPLTGPSRSRRLMPAPKLDAVMRRAAS